VLFCCISRMRGCLEVLSVALVRQGKDALPALRRAAELMPMDADPLQLGAALHDAGSGPKPWRARRVPLA